MKEMGKDLMVKDIEFNGDTINVIEHQGEYHIAMKPICDALGLDWDNQRKQIERDPVLNSTAVELTVVAQDGKQREMICLPLSYLNGWLFKIDAARYEGDRRDKIIRYQRECYQVLYQHFWGVPARMLEMVKAFDARVRLLESKVEHLEGKVSRKLPAASFIFDGYPVRLFLIDQHPMLNGSDILTALFGEPDKYLEGSAPPRLERAGLRRDWHFRVISTDQLAADYHVSPGYLLSYLGMSPQVRRITVVTVSGISALGEQYPEFYDWYMESVVPELTGLFRAFMEWQRSLSK